MINIPNGKVYALRTGFRACETANNNSLAWLAPTSDAQLVLTPDFSKPRETQFTFEDITSEGLTTSNQETDLRLDYAPRRPMGGTGTLSNFGAWEEDFVMRIIVGTDGRLWGPR